MPVVRWLLVLLALWGPALAAGVRVLAASDLRQALDALAREFEGTHPGVKLEIVYGSSGRFYRQLLRGLEADLFLSADTGYVRDLAMKGRILPRSVRVYARGQLSLFIPQRFKDPGKLPPERLLFDPRLKTLALANPVHAPYGRAAVRYLLNVGFLRWRQEPVPFEEMRQGLQRYLVPARPVRLVVGESVSHAAQLTLSAADAGLIARSLALPLAVSGKGRELPLAPEAYPPLLQAGGILKGHDRPEVRDFFAYLLSPPAQAVLARFGFLPPTP